jgi:hypothetical protein
MNTLLSEQTLTIRGGDVLDDWIIIWCPAPPDEPPFDPWIPGTIDPEQPTPLPWIQDAM